MKTIILGTLGPWEVRRSMASGLPALRRRDAGVRAESRCRLEGARAWDYLVVQGTLYRACIWDIAVDIDVDVEVDK